MRSLLTWIAAAATCALVAASGGVRVPGDDHDEVRGVTVSTPGMGLDWGSPEMVATLRDIRDLGGNWVTIHPYASIGDGGGRRGLLEGEVRSWSELDPENPPVHLVRPIREAHALGLKIAIKPHLAYWGTRFKWRGEIDFESPEAYERFFKTYEEWVLRLALLCESADAFVIGTELDLTLEHESPWKSLIAKLRERTEAPLTYAANWPNYGDVPFWEDLDVIGIQAYFPIAAESTADVETLRLGWAKRMKELREFGERLNRRIVFTELGYNCSTRAPLEPWAYRTESGEQAEQVQEACLRVALESIRSEPSVVGSFLWKWFPAGKRRPRNFDLQDPRIMKLVEECWDRGS